MQTSVRHLRCGRPTISLCRDSRTMCGQFFRPREGAPETTFRPDRAATSRTLAGQVGANPLAVSTADRPVLGSSPFRSFTHKHHEYPHEDHLQNEANHDNHVSE